MYYKKNKTKHKYDKTVIESVKREGTLHLRISYRFIAIISVNKKIKKYLQQQIFDIFLLKINIIITCSANYNIM